MSDNIKDDVSKIKGILGEIKTDVAVIKTDIAHHIKRTDLAEKRIEYMERWLLGALTAILIAVTGIFLKVLL